MDCSLPGSSVHGIFQARILEGVAISFSNAPNIRTPKCIKQILIDLNSETDNNTITEKWGQGCLMIFSEQLGDRTPTFNRTATAGLLTVAPTEKVQGRGLGVSRQRQSEFLRLERILNVSRLNSLISWLWLWYLER